MLFTNHWMVGKLFVLHVNRTFPATEHTGLASGEGIEDKTTSAAAAGL